MRKLLILLGCLITTTSLMAQQEAQFTQFMFNKLSLNPGYAGNTGVPCFSVMHRSQWVGVEGAPTSQILNFQMPLKKNRIGIGMSVFHDKIGPSESWTYQLNYSYGIQIEKGRLGIGLQGALRRFTVDLGSTNAIHAGDSQLLMGMQSKVLPNFGVGLYYQNPRFYLGASIPNMLRGDLSFAEGTSPTNDFSQEAPHFYFMGGLIIDAVNNVKFKPAILVKYTEHAPVKIDVNAMVIFVEKLWLGLTYRLGGNLNSSTGESIDAIVQYQLSRSLRAGLAYDYTLSKMKSYNSGTYEMMLSYCIINKDKVMTNPRFF